MDVCIKQLKTNMGALEYDMLQDIVDLENGFSNPPYQKSFSEYKEWLIKENNYSKGNNLPENWVPCTTFFFYINKIPVGYGRIRHSTNDRLEKEIGAGNLGYGIAKKYRKKGYGKVLFGELLKKCKEMGYKEIKLFPHKDNIATLKIMKFYGGQIIGEFNEQKYIMLIKIH